MTTLPQQLRHLWQRYDTAIRELAHSGFSSRDGPEFEQKLRELILNSRKSK